MATDEHDGMAAMLKRAETDHPGAAIDVRTGPNHCEIYMNYPAVVDLIKKLQAVVDMSLPTTGVCVTLVDTLIEGKATTLLSIETDDRSTTH